VAQVVFAAHKHL